MTKGTRNVALYISVYEVLKQYCDENGYKIYRGATSLLKEALEAKGYTIPEIKEEPEEEVFDFGF